MKPYYQKFSYLSLFDVNISVPTS
jgi:hypothetical protein